MCCRPLFPFKTKDAVNFFITQSLAEAVMTLLCPTVTVTNHDYLKIKTLKYLLNTTLLMFKYTNIKRSNFERQLQIFHFKQILQFKL